MFSNETIARMRTPFSVRKPDPSPYWNIATPSTSSGVSYFQNKRNLKFTQILKKEDNSSFLNIAAAKFSEIKLDLSCMMCAVLILSPVCPLVKSSGTFKNYYKL